MWDRFPPRTRKAITAALEHAGRCRRDEATPQDLLFAIANDPECAAAFMFEQAGITPQKLVEPFDVSDENVRPLPERAARLSSGMMHVLDVAVGEAARLKHHHVGTEHIALALSRVNGNPASARLKELDFTPARAETALRDWIRSGMPRRHSSPDNSMYASPLLRRLMAPIQRVMWFPKLAWHLYVGKSIGHPGFVSNPYPLYRKLRETQPVRRDPIGPVWIVTRYAETAAIMRDPRFKKDPFAAERLPKIVREQLAMPPTAAARASAEMISMLFLDPPEHTRVRGVFNKAFTPRRLESLRARIQLITDKCIERAQRNQSGTMDLMRDLAAPLPVAVIAELLGFPPEDYAKIKKWSDDIAEALALKPTTESQLRAAAARDDLRIYFDQIVEQLKSSPGDNLISALLAAGIAGPRGEHLSPDELFSNSILLLAAGHETTTNLIGNGMLALLRHPEQLQALREHPELIDSAIEELLRYDPPVQWTSRVAGEGMTLGGQTLQRGDIVLASLGAANRDPAVFPDPDRLDIRRTDNKHLSFGTGVHFCLGAALARMEAQIAIGTLIQRFPNLKLITKKPRWRKGITFRGVHALELSI
jgi:cytochrome P450